jgi:GntR family transcriptional repressor for pyruvate dehydrogenase complex
MFKKVSAGLSLSDKVARDLLQKIESGESPPGTKLPTEPELSKQFGVSRTVVREAISRLKNEGMVDSQQGSGVYVSEQSQLRPLRIKVEDATSSCVAPLRRKWPPWSRCAEPPSN